MTNIAVSIQRSAFSQNFTIDSALRWFIYTLEKIVFFHSPFPVPVFPITENL